MPKAPALIGKTRGKVRVRPIRDERGKTRGFQVDRGDGRMMGVVRPEPIRVKQSISGRDQE